MSRERQIVILTRDCPARTVPAGDLVVLEKHSVVEIYQQLGGSITVRNKDGLLRIDGEDADALGLDPVEHPVGADSDTPFSMELVEDALREVYDPEIPINIVELGLIYRTEEKLTDDGKRRIEIDLTMTAPGCGMGDVLSADAERYVSAVPGVDEVEVKLVFYPPWGMEMMSDEAKLELGFF